MNVRSVQPFPTLIELNIISYPPSFLLPSERASEEIDGCIWSEKNLRFSVGWEARNRKSLKLIVGRNSTKMWFRLVILRGDVIRNAVVVVVVICISGLRSKWKRRNKLFLNNLWKWKLILNIIQLEFRLLRFQLSAYF